MTESWGEFQKAGHKAQAALPGHGFIMSFDTETTPLYFVGAKTKKTAGPGGLPLATALVELARALVVQAQLLTCPAGFDGLYYVGSDPDRLFDEAARMQAAGVGAEVELARPTGPLAPAIPSGLLHELLHFLVVSSLFARDYALVMGRLVHRFDKAEAARPAAALAMRMDGAARVAVSLQLSTLRGANPPAAAAAGLLAPGITRYALPGCHTVHLREVTDTLGPEEPLSGPRVLARYWRALYNLALPAAPGLFARVSFHPSDAPTLLYPGAMLAVCALAVDDKHRPPLAEREQRLEARLLADLHDFFFFLRPARED